MITGAPPGNSFVFPRKKEDLICLESLHRKLPRRREECLLPAVRATAGAALQSHRQLYFGTAIWEKMRHFDLHLLSSTA